MKSEEGRGRGRRVRVFSSRGSELRVEHRLRRGGGGDRLGEGVLGVMQNKMQSRSVGLSLHATAHRRSSMLQSQNDHSAPHGKA